MKQRKQKLRPSKRPFVVVMTVRNRHNVAVAARSADSSPQSANSKDR